MAEIIASTYEVLSKIGAGGGGVVYLARHLRLNMLVVLKADRRKLSTPPEALRREVDSLKNLTHQYLPKVYDFISENGVVYTVMDYIEGESLDKPLKRGERFSQPEVIGMADQLLRALVYLHSRPPHGILHADIKPANIMRTPQGDIRLIDFNIALALGEKGAVRVGLSRGYASPEHYDSDVSAGPITRGLQKKEEPPAEEAPEKIPDEEVPTEEHSSGEEESKTVWNGGSAPKKTSPAADEHTVAGTALTEADAEETGWTSEDETSADGEETEKTSQTEENLTCEPVRKPNIRTNRAADEETVTEEGASAAASGEKPAKSEGSSPKAAEPSRTPQSPSSSSVGTKVMLDVRSDIYSLGATLYHLLTGERPDPAAENVKPIRRKDISPAVAAIIAKSMAPDPANRYQTAQEMLDAFRSLHDKDIRMIRHKRGFRIMAAFTALLFCAGGFSAFVGMKQLERLQNAYVLAGQSSAALADGDVDAALAYAVEALPVQRGLFDPPYTAEAERALAGALGVYGIAVGSQPHRTLTADSEPLKLALSPGGTRTAALTEGKLTVWDTDSGRTVAEFPAGTSALADVVFSGEDTILFAGDGAVQCMDLVSGTELWRGAAASSVSLSEDGSTAALLNKDDPFALIVNASDGSLIRNVSFGGKHQQPAVNDRFADPENDLFELSPDGNWLAVSFSDGSVEVFHTSDEEQDLTIYGPSDYTHFEGGFCGSDFAYALSGGTKNSVFTVVDLSTHEQLGAFSGPSAFHTRANSTGIYVSTDNVLVRLDPRSGEQTEVAYTLEQIVDFRIAPDYTIVRTSDGSFSLFNSTAGCIGEYTDDNPCDFISTAGTFAVTASIDSPVIRVTGLRPGEDQTVLTYDADFWHTETRENAADGTFMLYRYDLFRLYRADGSLLTEVSLPDAEQVYDQQFRRTDEGTYLEVIYNDGLHRHYSARDGSLLREYSEAAPDESLYEEFRTEHLLIRSPLHGTPTAHDPVTGELIAELEPDAYLAYVTQIGDHVMTEYISAEGERYGILLNERCEPVADLPGLCDVLPDGTLFFDDMYGTIRKTRIYSITELLALAN